jgi:nitroreductase
MTPANLVAWDLDPSAFDALPPEKRLAFLVRFAVLAPSSHNSQPWKFTVGPDAILAAADMSRSLPESDTDHRQLYLSVGCAIENLLAAADYYGYRTSVTRADVNGTPAWRVGFSGQPSPAATRKTDHPALAVPRRRTNRNAYEARPPEQPFLDWMKSLADDGLRLHLIAKDPLRKEIAKVVIDAGIEAMDDQGFRRELSSYVRPNTTKEMLGMPMYGFGMPTPPSLLAPWLVKNFNMNRATRRQDESLLMRHTPLFAIITTRADDSDAWIKAGRVYERIALEAERRGICTGPSAAAIQIGDNYKRLQKLLTTDFRPQMFFRLGYAKAAPKHSPRLTAERVISP